MSKFLVAVIVIGVLGAGYLWWQNGNNVDEVSGTDSEITESVSDAIEDGAVMEDGVMEENAGAAVSYDGSSFSPAEVTIQQGDTVTWTRESGGDMWVASAQHPTHIVYSGTTLKDHCPDSAGVAFDQCETGESYSFTFGETGTWWYHDHKNSSAFGSVVVE